jgi:hypothetical protein
MFTQFKLGGGGGGGGGGGRQKVVKLLTMLPHRKKIFLPISCNFDPSQNSFGSI